MERVGVRNVYVPTVPAEQASRSAMQRVVDAFFGGSAARAAVALLSDESLDDKTVLELQGLVHAAREEGR